MANDQLTNPQSSAQVSPPDTSYAGATIPPAASQPPAPVAQPQTPAAPPAPTAPTAPSVPPAAATQPTSQPQPTPQPKTKQEWFQHLIGKLTPPQNVVTTNPDGTQTVANKATPMSLAQLVITSALAGSFGTKDTYRQGAYGPILDRQASNADAFDRGQQIGQDYSQTAQKQQDDLQARKLTTVAANIAAAHNYAAMQQSQFAAEKEGAEAEAAQTKVMQNTADQNNATLGASADAYDQSLTDKDAPKARLQQLATWDELMNGPFKSKMTQQLMAQDGTRMVYDPATGRTKPVPTFSLYNPDVTLKLNKEAVDRAAKINPSFQGLYEITGGNVPLNLGRYVTLTHQINSIDHAEDTLQSLADSQDALAKKLGITGNVEGRLAAVVKGNPSAMKSLLEFENGKAQGGNTADQLNRLLQSDGGDAIFKALGTDRDKVQQFITDYNARIKATDKIADKAGAIAAQKAKPITPTTALGIANDPEETPERRQTAQAVIAGQATLAGSKAAAVAKAQEPFQFRKQLQEQALKTGSPEDAGRLMASGDLTLTELKSRGSTPAFIIAATNAAKQIDPKYVAQKADAEYRIAGNQQNTTFFGSANSLLDKDGTLDQLATNYAKLGNGQVPFFNKVEDYEGYQTGDSAMAGFMQTALGVADDYAKVMGGGTGSDTSRLQVLHSFSNAHNPQQMQAAIDAARAAVQSQTRSRIGSNTILQKMYGGTYGATPPAANPRQTPNQTPNQTTTNPTFKAVSSDGKWGWNGKDWVSTGAK